MNSNQDNHAQPRGQRDELDWPVMSGTVDQVLQGLETKARRRRVRRGIASSVALAAAFVLGAAWYSARMPGEMFREERRSTVLLQPKRQVLADGSVIELGEGARVAVNFTPEKRSVALLEGTAYFHVAKNRARPFVVSAGVHEVVAVGTAFSVERASEGMAVFVTEGRVAVYRDAAVAPSASGVPAPVASPDAFLDAGTSVVVAENPVGNDNLVVRPVDKAEQDAKLAWRLPKLVFAGAPLSEVVATFNRYNRVQFLIADPTIARMQLSGVLGANKVDGLVELLEADFGIKAERTGDQIALHRPQ